MKWAYTYLSFTFSSLFTVFREKNSKRKSASAKSTESNKKAKLKEPAENGKGKMKEQPSDNENEDAQAGEEINEVEDGADD